MKFDNKTVPAPGMDPATGPPAVGTEYRLLISTEFTLNAVSVAQGSYVLGRSRDADITVDDATISRAHARLRVGVDKISVEDLGSRNGTRVGGRPVAKGESVPCPMGCVIELGSATLVLQRGRGTTVVPASYTERAGAPAGTASRIVVDSAMQHLYSMLDLVAPTALNILVLGETGVGKEVFAAAVHERSLRSSAPFLQINAAALAPTTLEAELFGYEKGAFTGALAAKAGLFESADGGTVMLDEIGDMPLDTQVKILRVLESGETFRIGSLKPRRVDIRIVSATNRDLGAAIAGGAFRSDLYFRLNGITFTIPPLRSRQSEIGPLARMFAERAASKLGRPVPLIGAAVLRTLEGRAWMGNVRELRNVVERAVVLSGAGAGAELLEEHFPPDMVVPPVSQRAFRPEAPTFDEEQQTGRFDLLSTGLENVQGLASELRGVERKRIIEALEASRGNQSQAARDLGITRAVLLNRMKAFGLLPVRGR
jgi:transcriptional regulator with PAS, ATPase and Fis domain